MSLFFSIISLIGVFIATFDRKIKRAILALWISYVAVGAIYLTLGAEFLAIIQWIVATLIAISFIFFSVMFGEYHMYEQPIKHHERSLLFMAIACGLCFALLISLSMQTLTVISPPEYEPGSHLMALAEVFIQNHWISLEVLTLILFLVLVGGGVIARSERE